MAQKCVSRLIDGVTVLLFSRDSLGFLNLKSINCVAFWLVWLCIWRSYVEFGVGVESRGRGRN